MNFELSAGDELTILENNPIYLASSITNWKNLSVIDDNCQVIISLISFSEMNQYGVLNYLETVQKSGKIFIHFPFNSGTDFAQIDAIYTMIKKYTDQKILIYCPFDKMRYELFIGCYMIYDNISSSDVLEMFNLNSRYRRYVKKYSEKIILNQEINN